MPDSNSFPFLRLPFLAIQNVVHHMSCTEITELSLCSRRSKSIVRSVRCPEPTYIEIYLHRKNMSIYVMNRNRAQCSFWTVAMIQRGKKDPSKYRVYTIGGVDVRIAKIQEWGFRIEAVENPEKPLKLVVDHLRDVFKLPLEVVFMPDKIKDFLRFIPIFPVCKTLLLNGGEAITKEELEYIKGNVVVEYLFDCSIPIN
ncbi:hypothetical protein GCK72_003872 [Caenorhabditis remanei]|uniref:F-box domain-containing protein n=1 Tax=Caenorhabditis remanei TaxID=31234 RepID=A0A6A5HAQ5_CAERE|nr:hypothetical protein GCK72_003872 [Caenorhabditis remanei]KAF1763926.1 hypothetical protein GCK72_003872 [Caenorhabditis remanei]